MASVPEGTRPAQLGWSRTPSDYPPATVPKRPAGAAPGAGGTDGGCFGTRAAERAGTPPPRPVPGSAGRVSCPAGKPAVPGRAARAWPAGPDPAGGHARRLPGRQDSRKPVLQDRRIRATRHGQTVRCIHPAPVAWLPGQVPVEPLQRRPDHRALMPAACHDLPANRLSGTAQRLPHHRGLMVPGPPPQKMDTADADAYLGMVAEVDQRVLRPGLAAAPAPALACLVCRCVSLSAHDGSRLLTASVGARP